MGGFGLNKGEKKINEWKQQGGTRGPKSYLDTFNPSIIPPRAAMAQCDEKHFKDKKNNELKVQLARIGELALTADCRTAPTM